MPRTPLTLFEHDTVPYPWTERDLRLLDAINRQAGCEILTYKFGRDTTALRANQYVGVVRLGDKTIQILPKTYRAEGVVDSAREATANLLHLLAYAADVPISEQGVAPLLARKSDWFELLIHLFATHLASLWQRGALHTYRAVDQELGVLKGKWRIADQLRYPASLHQFHVTSDEFTADTEINRALRFVVERLWQLTRDGANRRQLELLREWMDGVSIPNAVNRAALDDAHLTRLNRAYVPVINLARLFLDGGALQLAADTTQAYSFVFDMNVLFESFVFRFLQRHRSQILPEAAAEWRLVAQADGCKLHLALHQGMRNAFALKPDIVARSGEQYPLLLDTKYKRLHPTKAALGIDPADFYQMHAYATCYECPRVILLYPQTAEHPEPLHHMFRLQTGRAVVPAVIEAHTIDLRCDLGKKSERAGLIQQLQKIFVETTNPYVS